MPKEKKEKKQAVPKTSQILRGFKDILPAEQPYWRYLYRIAEEFALAYGFEKIDPPIVEEAGLFVRSIGKGTDIVEKEMFSFADQGDGLVVLRPEATASIARAYVNHGMANLPQPVKLWYWGQMFRRERPQSGRQRQFHQYGFEVLGENDPVIDAQVIAMTYNFYNQIGLDGVSIQVNSIGCPDCRKIYLQELVKYFKSKRKMLCEDCKKRLLKNPLRILDCKKPTCQFVKNEAPQIVDWLDDTCRNHFMKVVEYLDEMHISYKLNPFLVRGLDYYTNTVFEVWPKEEKEGAQSALCGGGRYNGLVELVGGKPTPAVGVAIGIERIITQMRSHEIEPPVSSSPDIFLCQIGDQAKVRAMRLFEQLRREKIVCAESFSKDSLKSQLESANKLKVKYALILGQKEVMDGTILIRDMESGVQEIIDFNKTVNEMKKKLLAAAQAKV